MGKKLGSALIVFIWMGGMGLASVDAFFQSLSEPSALHLREVKLSKAGKQTTLALHFSQPPEFVHAFVLQEPARLVIDVGRVVGQSPSTMHAAADALVARLRIGSHPSHTRYVFDLKADQTPPVSVTQHAHLVTAVLKEQGGQADAAQEVHAQMLFSFTESPPLSQSVPPAPAQILSAPNPMVLAKKASPLGATPPRVTSSLPAPVPLATPQVSGEDLPPQSASQVKMAAVPHAPPSTPASARPQLSPEISSQNTPQPQTLSSTASQHLESPPRSQSVPPAPAQVLSAPNPIVLAKKASPLGATPPRVTSSLPAPVPLATPQVSGEDLPPQSASQVKMAAVPHAPPSTPASARPQLSPEISSQNTPQPQTLSSTASQHLRRGQSLYTEGNFDGAILQWQKAAHLAPTNAEVQYRLGLALQNRGDLTQAITAFAESLRLNPNEANVHIHLARALEVKGNTQEALAAYNNALQLVPNSAHVHNRLGHVLVAEGDVAGAVQAWQQTIHLQPDYAYAYVSLGEALAQQGQKAEALAVYERALLLDPQAPFVADVRQRVSQLRSTNLSEENAPRRLIRQNENGAGQPEISG